jgi:hypothetical protein
MKLSLSPAAIAVLGVCGLGSAGPILVLFDIAGGPPPHPGPPGVGPRAEASWPAVDTVSRGRAFYFTRAMYTGYGRRFQSWRVDYPKADIQFLIGLRRLTNIDAFEFENPVRLDDPELRRFPFLYALEVGFMALTEPEVLGLRNYLLAGGFLVIDDFWGTYQWANFQVQMERVLPEYDIVDIPMDHPIMSAFYYIEEILQVPNVGLGRMRMRTWEQDGFEPALRGVFDERGHLMVVINWNTDLGDAWEWAEDPTYPWRFSNFAYKLGVNMIIYAMSH